MSIIDATATSKRTAHIVIIRCRPQRRSPLINGGGARHSSVGSVTRGYNSKNCERLPFRVYQNLHVGSRRIGRRANNGKELSMHFHVWLFPLKPIGCPRFGLALAWRYGSRSITKMLLPISINTTIVRLKLLWIYLYKKNTSVVKV